MKPSRLSEIGRCARKAGILTEALREGGDPEVLEAARALIDRIIIHAPGPDGGPPGIELVGELTAMLNMACDNQGIAADQAAPTDPVLALFVSSVKEYPGAEPLAFLGWVTLKAGWYNAPGYRERCKSSATSTIMSSCPPTMRRRPSSTRISRASRP